MAVQFKHMQNKNDDKVHDEDSQTFVDSTESEVPQEDSKNETQIEENEVTTNTADDIPDDSDEIVDDIVQEEGDTVLEASDAEISKAFEPVVHKNLREKFKDAVSSWWNNKKLRYGTFAGLIIVIVLISAIPTTRYFVLNTVGIRSSASIVVYDDQTNNPLKNVQVSIAGQSSVTDIEGKARLTNVKLGRNELKIQKRAYAETVKIVTIGWGSNPLGNANIKAVGAQYSFIVSDWLSGKPVYRVEASSGNFDATSDEKGALTLVVDASSDENLEVVFKAAGYRDEKIKVDNTKKDGQAVKLVSRRSHPFISKRSGKYDLYKIDADGKNEKLVLAGTGSENESIGLVTHPTKDMTAMVSARDNLRNKQGYLLSTLTLVDLSDNSTTAIAQSEQIQIIGWSGEQLLYVQIAAGASAANSKRQRLISYNYKTEEKTELASSNNFNDVLLIGNKVYYGLSNPQPGFFEQSVDSKNRTTILDKETWSIYRLNYSKLDLSVGQDWYQLNVGEANAKKQTAQPAALSSRNYSDSSDGSKSLWVDQRDGKGTLVLYDKEKDKDTVLIQQAGLENPVRWLSDNTLVYRIRTSQESADYVLNIEGGTPKKIRDVTATFGVDRWYH